jgi:hypothetical protein
LVSITDHSKNYSNYRCALKKIGSPAIPYLGLVLNDLVCVSNGSPDTCKNGKIINFGKYAAIAKITNDYLQFKEDYSFFPVLEIHDYLSQSIEARGVHKSEELYELSLEVEPKPSIGSDDKENNIQEMVTMLQKAGMM